MESKQTNSHNLIYFLFIFPLKVIRDIEKKQELDNFPMYGERGPQYNNEFFEKHLTRKFYDKAGGVIGMFDGILNETELATLRRYLSQHNTAYSNSGFTTREDDDSDNVSWIAMFLVSLLTCPIFLSHVVNKWPFLFSIFHCACLCLISGSHKKIFGYGKENVLRQATQGEVNHWLVQ